MRSLTSCPPPSPSPMVAKSSHSNKPPRRSSDRHESSLMAAVTGCATVGPCTPFSLQWSESLPNAPSFGGAEGEHATQRYVASQTSPKLPLPSLSSIRNVLPLICNCTPGAKATGDAVTGKALVPNKSPAVCAVDEDRMTRQPLSRASASTGAGRLAATGRVTQRAAGGGGEGELSLGATSQASRPGHCVQGASGVGALLLALLPRLVGEDARAEYMVVQKLRVSSPGRQDED
jgi:hypothetical protein